MLDPAAAPTPRRLRVVVLASGTATMALQMAAVRLLAPAMGASSIVWATIIGLSLLAMALGYTIGGRLADNRADGRTLAATLAAAAALVAAIPLVAQPVLDHLLVTSSSPAWTDLADAAIAYSLLALAPAILLGITPPYTIRMAIPHVDHAGRTAGSLYALSTVGSIVGTLLTALVLVQWIGTRDTIWGIAALLAIAAALAWSTRALAPAARVEPGASELLGAVEEIGDDDQPHTAPPGVPHGAIPFLLAGAIVLVEGMAMMATEMSIARLVAPFFGASHAVWAVIIATVMGSIALGSRIGGRCADRWPTLGALVVLLSLAATAVAVLPFLASPVMRLSTGGIEDVAVGTVVGTFLGTMALLVVPVTLLGMVPPWVLRLAVPDVSRSGRTAGRLYALSTTGALVGTFTSVLWLIPAIGTRHTMLVFAGALALAATVVWVRRLPKVGRRSTLLAPASLVVVALLLLAPTGLVKPLDDARVLDERESRYQFIQTVQDRDGRHLLQLNEGWAVHSIWDPDTVLTGGIWDHFLVVPALRRVAEGPIDCSHTGVSCSAPITESVNNTRSMLVIGSAAGTTKRAFDVLRPSTVMTSVELDPEVTAVGRKYFDLTGTVNASDGRPFLRRSRGQWDVIHVDAYRQPYIPFYLTTREFFELAKSHLTDGGVLSINVGSTPEDQRINEAVAATMRSVFPFVARYRAEDYNEVIVAVDEPGVTLGELRERIRSSDLATGDSPVYLDHDVQTFAPGDLPLDPAMSDERHRMQWLFEDFADGMVEVDPDPDKVMTDDRAPVEWMTDRMIFGAAE